ncbi:MAG: hypothetical protein KJO50_01460 [Bacteroidia bacterium]|nr:hypothetical protein [Bacteroidia bacterium]MBT8228896.1 hypothetical protein [Bacteroidia bacterium]
MNHPFWKKVLSHFTEISLEKTSSGYNPYLEVRLVQGRHQLITKDAIYSFDDKYENFNRVFRKINWSGQNVKSVLVLGLGLGSVIYILDKKLKLEFDYTTVEIDPEICRLAYKYTLKDIHSFIEILQIDGLDYIQSTTDKFDLVIMDIFQSALIPMKFQSEQYLGSLNELLNHGGCLLYNRMNITQDDEINNDLFRPLFKKEFPQMAEMKVKDNLIFMSNKQFLN